VRFIRLDTYLLNAREANWAYDAWSMFYGRPLPIGQDLPDSSPFMLVWNSVPFYLFGVTDATARMGSALLGVGLVGLVFLLHPFLSKPQMIATAGILAISPTVVFASRTVEPGIAAAFFALLVVVALLRIGATVGNHVGWAVLLGLAVACLYGTGPLGVTTLIAIAIGITVAGLRARPGELSRSAVGTAIRRLPADRHTLGGFAVGLVLGLFTLFSRLFSDFTALAGIATTLTDWVAMMTEGSSSVPAVFYFWSTMLYETIAILIAIGTLFLSRRIDHGQFGRHIPRSLFIGWFVVALLLHTTASARDTGSAVLVVLPLLLLAGYGLGRMVEGAGPVASIRSGAVALAAVVLVAYSLNAMIGLAYVRGESGSEPLAQDIPTEEARDFIDRVMRLSRDLSVTEPSPIDPTGQYGLTIRVTPEHEWPFTWYFRQFDDFAVTPAAGLTAETDVAIASNTDAMESAGLTTSTNIWLARPGDPLTSMKSGTILRTGLNPLNWDDAWDYMINREAPSRDEARVITVGYSVRVINKLTTQTGPFNLFDQSSPGPGSGLGQLDSPTGIATGPDGTIYVLNAANARIDRYAPDGTFIGIWNGQVEEPLKLGWNGVQGGTGLEVGPDGLIYIADTWNHAVVVVAADGKVVRVLGNRGVQTDITDTASPDQQPGLFFGPRDIAVTGDRIYITDTGNERVQVFAMDGTFIAAFGGFGEGEGQFVEPTGIAVAPDGTIWVADSGNARLQQFDAEGSFITNYPIPEWEGQQGINRLNMLAFDDNGILYFTVPYRGVWAWHEGERIQLTNNDLNAGGLALTSDGTLLVTDMNAATVLRIQPQVPEGWLNPAATPQASPLATPAR
jgi:uncharacterized protein (TIGR03663 family)